MAQRGILLFCVNMCNFEDNLFLNSFTGLLEEYRSVIKKYMLMSRYGLEMGREWKKKGRPIHQNTRRNPRPWQDNWSLDGERRYRKPAYLRSWDMLMHLTGKRAFFLKNRYGRRIALYALDIDGEPGTSYEKAADFARQILASYFPAIESFVEPGRSYPEKGGCYVWFLVDWGATSPSVRNAFENAINRLLKKAHPKDCGPEGIHFDRLAGQVTYDIPNPHFDPEYADEICTHRCVEEILVQDDPYPNKQVWISCKDAEKLNKELPGFVPEDAPKRSRWIGMTREESYQLSKIFYGIGFDNEVDTEARFPFNPRLEKNWTHFGSLVTAPCFAALSEDRPNNLDAFFEWEASRRGKITRKQIEKILPEEELSQILDLEKRLVAGDKTPISDDIEPLDEDEDRKLHDASSLPILPNNNTKVKGIDALRLQPDGDCWLGKTAGGRSALRQTHGDREAAVQLAVEIYEASGLATGMTEVDRASRYHDAERCVDYAAQTFNLQASRGPSMEVWFDQIKDVREMAMRLRGRISKRMLAQASVHQRLSYDHLGHILCWFLKNMVTGNMCEVPFKSIPGGLAHHGVYLMNSAIAQALRLLQDARIIVLIENHAQGRCRKYRLHAQAIIPHWVRAHITPAHYHQLKHNAIAHNTAGTPKPHQPAATLGHRVPAQPASFSFPPDNMYWGNHLTMVVKERLGEKVLQGQKETIFKWKQQNAQMSL